MNIPKSRDIQAKIPLPQAIWNEFGYVTVNGVDSNVAGLHAIVDWIVCIIYGITTERKKEATFLIRKAASNFLNYSLLS